MARTIFRRKKKKPTGLGIMIGAGITAVAVTAGVLIFALRPPAETKTENKETETTVTTTTRTLPKEFIDRNTYSPSVMLYDVTNQQVLYSKNSKKQRAPASLTKLMTALVAVEHTPEDYVFTVGDELSLVLPGSSTADLWMGNQLNRTQMLQALLMKSGNDAAYVIAVQVGRLIEENPSLSKQAAVNAFCDEMNRKAKELGCTRTEFRNPDGFDKNGHLTTAADMMKICVASIENPLIAEVCATYQVDTTLVSGRQVSWKNSNLLLNPEGPHYYEGANGLKTGTTDDAGYCLAASATRDGRTVIALVLGAEDNWQDTMRWSDTSGLLDLAFQ